MAKRKPARRRKRVGAQSIGLAPADTADVQDSGARELADRIKKDGGGVSIEFTIVPLRDGAGELTGLAAIMRDVTKRFEETRALKQKLAEATKPSR